MDKLQWFKFAPSDWMMGKIMRCDEITQARYMRLVCLYWNKECNLSYEDAEIEIDEEHLKVLVKKKIVKVMDDSIFIEFLDEQMEGISETSAKRREAVKKRWDKVKENKSKALQSDTLVLQNDTLVLQSDTEESRVEESRGEKKREETNKALPFSFFNSLILLGADKQLASDFIKVRKVKKATNTLTAFNGFKKQLDKSGLNINKVLLECVEKSWGSFKAEWSEQKKEVLNPDNEKIITFKSNLDFSPKKLPESKFLALQEQMKDGGYIYTVIN